jgi:uncharacterized protein YigE (DUF2233 family)
VNARAAGLALALAGGCGGAPAGPAGVQVEVVEHAGERWTVATVDLRHAELRLVGQHPDAPRPHTLHKLGEWVAGQGAAPIVSMNAGIYMEDRRPLGLHIEAGTQYRGLNTADGYGNFYLKPNGVFSIDAAGARLTPTEAWDQGPEGVLLATQSGPLLVSGGALHPALQPGSTNLKTRNGVGVRDPHTVVLAVSQGPVRFFDMATLFRDALHCPDALYLDGTVSAMRTPAEPDVPGDPEGYGGVLVVVPRAPGSDQRKAPR